MISDPRQAFVWIWLPGADRPVVAGRLDRVPDSQVLSFIYAGSYLRRAEAIPLYLPELPLGRGPIFPAPGEVAGCIADAGPDSWGQRVILNRRGDDPTVDLDLLVFLLESNSDRTGALDFQQSADTYEPRGVPHATVADLSRLAESASRVESGEPLSPDLDAALFHGTSIGGARPKALVADEGRSLIAKFSAADDVYSYPRAEFLAMELARRSGIEVANVDITAVQGKDVLLGERFDRPGGGRRLGMVSALTILGLSEMTARYASYAALADQIRARFTRPAETLRELFARITFNILCSNTDDHARNHSAFWDGQSLTLTPAYDICPQRRAGNVTRQLMAIGRDGYRDSQLIGCVERASTYLLSESEARELIDHQIDVIEGQWDEVCDLAGLSTVERSGFRRRQFLNPYALEGY